jgi:hypothetical protein
MSEEDHDLDWPPDDQAPEGADVEAEQMDAAYKFARRVELEAQTLRVRDAARRKLAAEQGGNVERPPLVKLRDFLTEDDAGVAFRVDGWWPLGGRIVCAAQWKAGKSTVVANLLRALADGGLFLGKFTVTQAERIVLIDDELDPRMLRSWLRDQAIINVDAVELVSLRGAAASFNILDPACSAEWVNVLAGADVTLLDCLRPILDALGLDENRDAGRFLVSFDALLAGIGDGSPADGFVVHHMGHIEERSRGDSRIIDWPDATWTLTRQDPKDPRSPRFLSAFGRDVDQREGRLEYDPATRHLTYVGGNRAEAIADELWETIKTVLKDKTEGLSGRETVTAMQALGASKHPAEEALKLAVSRQLVTQRDGPGNAKLHTLSGSSFTPNVPVSRSVPAVSRDGECVSVPVSLRKRDTDTHTTDSAEADPRAGTLNEETECSGCGEPLSTAEAAVSILCTPCLTHARHPDGAP